MNWCVCSQFISGQIILAAGIFPTSRKTAATLETKALCEKVSEMESKDHRVNFHWLLEFSEWTRIVLDCSFVTEF